MLCSLIFANRATGDGLTSFFLELLLLNAVKKFPHNGLSIPYTSSVSVIRNHMRHATSVAHHAKCSILSQKLGIGVVHLLRLLNSNLPFSNPRKARSIHALAVPATTITLVSQIFRHLVTLHGRTPAFSLSLTVKIAARSSLRSGSRELELL